MKSTSQIADKSKLVSLSNQIADHSFL